MKAGTGNDSREPSEPDLSSAGIRFADAESAGKTLARLTQQIPPGLAKALPAVLSDSPDPDSALILLDRLVSESPEELVRLLDRDHTLAHYAALVFGHSQFLGETLLQNWDLLPAMLREKNLDRSFSLEDFRGGFARFRSRRFETDVALLLSRFKRREYVRIMLRDVLKIAPLAETTAEISGLADVLIEETLRECSHDLRKRFGAPRHWDVEGRLVETPFAILSLGKLGGNELNYSSDVDLFYLFGDGAEPEQAAISNREYFIRLAQRVTQTLSQVTREGPVFRIDMRLRPQGNEGELAVSLSQAVRYYAHIAHDWERQALIKARHSAGDSSLTREFTRLVQPQVYTRSFNFLAVETALGSRERMHDRRRRRRSAETFSGSIDVKLDRGGIRDIEFLVQCLQRVYGGSEVWLRSGGTLFSLQKLHDKQHLSGKDFHELTSAYEFLRHVEHRLQLRHGQQRHHLPTDKAELHILERALQGYFGGNETTRDLVAAVKRRMQAVSEIYQRLIHRQQERQQQQEPGAPFALGGELEPAAADSSTQQILARLAIDEPAIFRIARRGDLAPQARKNLFRFLSAAFTSSERYGAVIRSPRAVELALALFEQSDYLTEILVRHPDEITSLVDLDQSPFQMGSGYLFDGPLADLKVTGDPVFEFVASSPVSYGERLALLRRHYRHRVFAAAARDVVEPRDVYASFAATTAVAEDAIAATFSMAGAPKGLAVFALGRMGSGEFDIMSDADLLFVCDDGADRVGLAKSCVRIVQALSAYTRDGTVFPVDVRLRPRGGEGELVLSTSHLRSYFEKDAQPFEALVYTKLHFLVGSRPVAEQASTACGVLFDHFSSNEDFPQAVRDMRMRLEEVDSGKKNFKTMPGAIYDIDFLAGFLQIKHSIHPKGGNLRDRLWRCSAAGVLSRADAAALDHAAELLRTTDHLMRLVTARTGNWLPTTGHAREVVERLVGRTLRRDFGHGLERELVETCRSVREIYDRVVG